MSFGDLQRERQRVGDRITQLTLLRDSLLPNATYALSSADLRYAGLVRTRGLPLAEARRSTAAVPSTV